MTHILSSFRSVNDLSSGTARSHEPEAARARVEPHRPLQRDDTAPRYADQTHVALVSQALRQSTPPAAEPRRPHPPVVSAAIELAPTIEQREAYPETCAEAGPVPGPETSEDAELTFHDQVMMALQAARAEEEAAAGADADLEHPDQAAGSEVFDAVQPDLRAEPGHRWSPAALTHRVRTSPRRTALIAASCIGSLALPMMAQGLQSRAPAPKDLLQVESMTTTRAQEPRTGFLSVPAATDSRASDRRAPAPATDIQLLEAVQGADPLPSVPVNGASRSSASPPADAAPLLVLPPTLVQRPSPVEHPTDADRAALDKLATAAGAPQTQAAAKSAPLKGPAPAKQRPASPAERTKHMDALTMAPRPGERAPGATTEVLPWERAGLGMRPAEAYVPPPPQVEYITVLGLRVPIKQRSTNATWTATFFDR